MTQYKKAVIYIYICSVISNDALVCYEYKQKCYYDTSYCDLVCQSCQKHECVKVAENGETIITCPCECFRNCEPTRKLDMSLSDDI